MRRRGDRTDMEELPILAFFASPASPIDYDWERRIAYLRLLDPDGDCADWCEAIGLVIEG